MMFTNKWQSIKEIDKAYSEHRESVKMSGVEFDETGLIKEWVAAIAQFEEENSTPVWMR